MNDALTAALACYLEACRDEYAALLAYNAGEMSDVAYCAAMAVTEKAGDALRALGANVGVVHEHGIDAVFSVLSKPCALDEALRDAAANVELTARNVAAVLRMGLARA